MVFSRRQFLRYGGASAAGCAFGSLGGCSPIFRSPDLEPFVAELRYSDPIEIGSSLRLHSATHQFHPALPRAESFAMQGHTFGGPRFQAVARTPSHTTIHNGLGAHPLRAAIDPTIPGTLFTDAIAPRVSMHLHGGVTPAEFDGHPMDTFLPGESHRYEWPNVQEACALWVHDHAHGITRLNVHAGLFATYDLRDEFDTGTPSNPIGLPTGEFEYSLALQDRGFDEDGNVRFRAFTFVPEGSWEGGMIGDLVTVNGQVWPRLNVAHSLYRFRLLNASNLTTYNLRLSNGAPIFVIGNDQGLLDAPVSCANVMLSPGERLDTLMDFSAAAPGERVILENSHPQPFQAALFGTAVVRQVMAFDVHGGPGAVTRIPERLRGSRGLGALLEPLESMVANVAATREVTIIQVGNDRNPPAWMTLDNVGFNLPATPSVQGRAEQWNFVNLTPDDHPMHLHLGRFRVLGRTRFNPLSLSLQSPRPEAGVEWHPGADQFVTEPMQPPALWERGWKDTVLAPGLFITRVVVEWPTASELGFDPDAPYSVASHHGVSHSHEELQGYVFHCHVLDHEDFEMMRPFRVVAP